MRPRPKRSCCPVPSHLGQTWCAWLYTHPFIFGLFLHLEHLTHGLSFNDSTQPTIKITKIKITYVTVSFRPSALYEH
jgi:hypothetical protein